MEIPPGVTGLLGANGSGKTTLLGLLLGLHPPEEGELRVLGLDPTTAGPEVRARVGYSPEHHSLPPDVKAVDFVRHIAELHGLPRREATGRASDVLWQVGLGEERVRPIGTMSTGQRQRVKLAQAIVHDPVLVLLDEPTEGLDPVQRDDMLALIRRVGSEFGIHIVSELARARRGRAGRRQRGDPPRRAGGRGRAARRAALRRRRRGGRGRRRHPAPRAPPRGQGHDAALGRRPALRERGRRRRPTSSATRWPTCRWRSAGSSPARSPSRRSSSARGAPVARRRRSWTTRRSRGRAAGRARRPPRGRPQRRGAAMTDTDVVERTATARILDRGYRRYTGRAPGHPRRDAHGRAATASSGPSACAAARGRRCCRSASCCSPTCRPSSSSGWSSLLPETTTGDGPTIQDVLLPTYGEYFGFVSLLVVLFVAFVAPEMLCTDRRTGMLGLYLASPLTRDTYLVAKAAGDRGRALAGHDRARRCSCWSRTSSRARDPTARLTCCSPSLRIVGAGPDPRRLYTALSMGVSSLTDRKAFATVAPHPAVLPRNVVAGVLIEAVGLSENLIVLNLFLVPLALVQRIHGESRALPGGDPRRRWSPPPSSGPPSGRSSAASATTPHGDPVTATAVPVGAIGVEPIGATVQPRPMVEVDGVLEVVRRRRRGVRRDLRARARASPRCSGRTAPASRRCCACSAAWCRPTAARCASSAATPAPTSACSAASAWSPSRRRCSTR